MKPADAIIPGLSATITSGFLFDAIALATSRFAKNGRTDQIALDICIRLLDAVKSGRVVREQHYLVWMLAETAGLFPYVEMNQTALRSLVNESHRVRPDKPFVFHAGQMRVFLSLMDGDNVILSAPTSFGKSAIIDYFIMERLPRTVVIIVPTIALIDETRRRLHRSLGDFYQILFHKDDIRNNRFAIYVMTQERLLDRADIDSIDLLFVDEFYKLDPDRKDQRYQLLNIAVYKYSRISRQIFMAGPHISGIDFGLNWKGRFTFIQTDYRTVAVDIIDRSDADNRMEAFLSDYLKSRHQLSIAFTASPNSAGNLANAVLEADGDIGDDQCVALANWLSENYSEHWSIVDALRGGIGTHHGRLPRSIASKMIDLFEGSHLRLLICTSTLIEGVNTSAANVYVFDKKINTTDFDFFSFANIRGRAGRMMRHFVGRVYLYHQAPEEVSTTVTVPAYAGPEDAEEAILFSVDPRDMDQSGMDRRADIMNDTGLTGDVIRRFGSLGVDNLVSLRDAIATELSDNPDAMVWSGLPSKEQRDLLFNLVFNHLFKPNRKRVGARSGQQLSYYVDQLRRVKTIKKFFSWLVKTGRMPAAESVEVGFEFLRAAEFTIPIGLIAAETILNDIVGEHEADFTFYATLIENYFRPSWMRALEERGIPYPICEKLRKIIGDEASVDHAIIKLRQIVEDQQSIDLSSLELDWVQHAS